MDLVAAMTFQSLQESPAAKNGDLSVELICPGMPHAFRTLLGDRGFNADRLSARFVHYPRHLRRLAGRFDIFHVLDHSYSQLVHALAPERCLVTCHDIDTFRPLLSRSPEPRPWWFRKMSARILSGMRRAAHVVAVSNATAEEIRSQEWIPETRLSVIPNGISEEFFAEASPEAMTWAKTWLAERGLVTKPWLLHVGSAIDRKRIDVLLRILAETAKSLVDVQLVRVGANLTQEQRRLAMELGVSERIHQAPFLSREQLRAIYGAASLVLQPSSYEGFGLPVAEAQASGAVLVASDIPVLREVGGAPAHFAPVGDIVAWTSQVLNLLRISRENQELWQDLRAAARQNAARFRWEQVANSLIARYQYMYGLLD
jgi:glycosyltransferase involved in cell wall biosynthesis